MYREMGVYWMSLPVSIYMCTMRLIELTVAWQNSKPVSCKMHAFLQNAISFVLLYRGFFMNQYPSFIHTKIQPYIFPMLVLFLQGTGIEKLDYVLFHSRR